MEISYGSKRKDGSISFYLGEQITREQLETVVEKHREGLLMTGGDVHLDPTHTILSYNAKAPGCIMQHLYHDPSPSNAFCRNRAVAIWFDDMYKPTWPDWMLRDMMMQSKLVEE